MQRDRRLAALLTDIGTGRLSRRDVMRQAAWLGLSGASATALATAATRPQMARAQAGEGIKGGTLTVATIGEPPHLDEHQSTAEIIAVIGYCAYEGLFTYDATYQADPRAGRDAHRQRRRSDPHDGAAPGRHVPQRRGDEGRRRDRLRRALGPDQRRRQAPHGEDQRAGPGRRLHARVPPQRAVRHDPDRAGPQHPGLHDPPQVDPRRGRRRADHRTRISTSAPARTGWWSGSATRHALRALRRLRASHPRTVRTATAARSTPTPTRSSSSRCRTRRRAWPDLQAGDYHLALDIGNDQYTVLQDFPGRGRRDPDADRTGTSSSSTGSRR